MPKKTKQPEVKLSKKEALKILLWIINAHRSNYFVVIRPEKVDAFEKLVTFLIKEF